MKITVFTSNQPRHISLVETLGKIADQVHVVQECNTIFPGQVDDFYKKSEVMQRYFGRVIEAEEKVFGRPRFLNHNVSHLSMKMGDLNRLEMEALTPALQSDVYVVFGASFIKGPLCDFLVERRAFNIHMGISPYYRGSSCNFWALYDRRPDYLGATVHLLTKGLDSGPMLFHVFPKAEEVDGFLLGMKSVKAAHDGLAASIASGEVFEMEPVIQDKSLQFRYTRNTDFNDEVAERYLAESLTPQEIHRILQARPMDKFLNSYIGR
jgi:methionyl-tRNA formyltransferase